MGQRQASVPELRQPTWGVFTIDSVVGSSYLHDQFPPGTPTNWASCGFKGCNFPLVPRGLLLLLEGMSFGEWQSLRYWGKRKCPKQREGTAGDYSTQTLGVRKDTFTIWGWSLLQTGNRQTDLGKWGQDTGGVMASLWGTKVQTVFAELVAVNLGSLGVWGRKLPEFAPRRLKDRNPAWYVLAFGVCLGTRAMQCWDLGILLYPTGTSALTETLGTPPSTIISFFSFNQHLQQLLATRDRMQ